MRLAVWPAAPARSLARALAQATDAAGQPLVTSVVEVEPHAMRARLDDASVDLALVTALDALRAHDGLALVPRVALAGEASPRRALVATAALDAIATVAFDPHDTQEALLAQLVLREAYGLAPQFAPVDLAQPLGALLEAHGAVLAPADAATPEGAYRLDLGREFADLTLRPMPWGLVAARADALSPAAAQALAAAAAAADVEGDDALRAEGVAAYQFTLDGYAFEGLVELADHLFATGTLTEIPELPFVDAGPVADEPAGDGAAA